MTITFDPDVLQRLAADMESQDAMLDFVRRYRRLLTGRVARVSEAIAAGDHKDAMDAVLSLTAASATLGGGETVQIGHDIEASLRRGELTRAERMAGALPGAARRLDEGLVDFLEHGGHGPIGGSPSGSRRLGRYE